MQRYKRWRWGKPLSCHWEGKLYFQRENGKCPNGYKHFLLPAEQTLLWIASCCYLTDGKQHSARWPEDISLQKFQQGKRQIWEEKGDLERKDCNLEINLKKKDKIDLWIHLINGNKEKSEIIRHVMEEETGCLITHLRKIFLYVMLRSGSMTRGDCSQR